MAKISDLRKQLRDMQTEHSKLEKDAQKIWDRAAYVQRDIDQLKNRIIINEKLLSGRWRFVEIENDTITFSAYSGNFKELEKLIETDSHGYYDFEYHQQKINFRHDDGHLTIRFTFDQFRNIVPLLANFEFDIGHVREKIASVIMQREHLEKIERIIERRDEVKELRKRKNHKTTKE